MNYTPRKYESTNGFTILVGRNSRENVYLSTVYAKDSDIFFHVSDYPGSHVILEVSEGSAPLKDDLLDAGSLAVHYSKAKKALVKVDYCLAKEVTRPKGLPSGTVELGCSKTIKIKGRERLKKFL